jgi:hypothetical protein
MPQLKHFALVLCLVCTGCARLTGLPAGDAQLRIFEGDAVVKGGNLVTPVRGDGAGHGCIVTQVGHLTARVAYRGERCAVEHLSDAR